MGLRGRFTRPPAPAAPSTRIPRCPRSLPVPAPGCFPSMKLLLVTRRFVGSDLPSTRTGRSAPGPAVLHQDRPPGQPVSLRYPAQGDAGISHAPSIASVGSPSPYSRSPLLTCTKPASLTLFSPSAAGLRARTRSRKGPGVLFQPENTNLQCNANAEG